MPMFQKEKKSIGIDIEMNQSNSKQVELEVRASKTAQKDNLDKLFKEVVQHIIIKNAPKKQPYSIAIGRQKTNKNPNYEGYADLVDFSLNVIDILDNLDNLLDQRS